MSRSGWVLRSLTSRSASVVLFLLALAFPSELACLQSSPVAETWPGVVADLFALDRRHAWVSINTGTARNYLLATQDGGRSWSCLPFSDPTFQVFFVDPANGWILGEPASHPFQLTLFRTSDSGRTWTSLWVFSQGEADYKSITGLAFADRLHGWFAGKRQWSGPDRVFRTLDGGRSVLSIDAFSRRFGLSMRVFADQQGDVWIVGQGSIFYSKDYGESWHQQIAPEQRGLRYASLWGGRSGGRGRAWIVGQRGGRGIILLTRNYGRDWEVVFDSSEAITLRDLAFWDSEHGCAIGVEAGMICTTDGGETWSAANKLPVGDQESSRSFSQIAMFDARKWLVLREDGLLFQTLDGGVTWRHLDLEASAAQRCPRP